MNKLNFIQKYLVNLLIVIFLFGISVNGHCNNNNLEKIDTNLISSVDDQPELTENLIPEKKDIKEKENFKYKKKNAIVLLWQSIKSAKQSLWAFFQILFVLTIILSSIFYFVESKIQPKEYNYLKALVWGFTLYIGDPGKFSGPGPKTIIGRITASLIGIIGILIFAVPAGIIASSFTSTIENENNKEHLAKIDHRLMKSFMREQDPVTLFRYVPRYISFGTLQAKKNMTEKDIMDAIENNDSFRLRNLATAVTKGKQGYDQLVIEMFPHNTEYGCFIDRGSNITIACPTSSSEAGIGNFGYHLALIGGFNYISKEYEPDMDDLVSFYLIDDINTPNQRSQYLQDIKKLADKEKNWTIFIISSERESDKEMHFISNADPEIGIETTLLNKDRFVEFYDSASINLEKYYNIKSELNDEYRPVKSKNSSVVIGGGKTTNAFTLRISSEFVVWDERYLALANELARNINNILAENINTPTSDYLKEKGLGYQK